MHCWEAGGTVWSCQGRAGITCGKCGCMDGRVGWGATATLLVPATSVVCTYRHCIRHCAHAHNHTRKPVSTLPAARATPGKFPWLHRRWRSCASSPRICATCSATSPSRARTSSTSRWGSRGFSYISDQNYKQMPGGAVTGVGNITPLGISVPVQCLPMRHLS